MVTAVGSVLLSQEVCADLGISIQHHDLGNIDAGWRCKTKLVRVKKFPPRINPLSGSLCIYWVTYVCQVGL